MAGIKVGDVDVKRNRILIQRAIDVDGSEKRTKTGAAREIPISNDLMAKIVERTKMVKPSDYIFAALSGGPWTRGSWRVLWRKIYIASGRSR